MYSVMIVDDEAIIRKGISNFIEWASLNCQVVVEASNGLEAMAYLGNHAIDIVISDIKMPGADGIALSKHIYEHYPNTKVILLTGYSDFKYAQSAIKYNIIEFILKPSSNDKILKAVEDAIDVISNDRLQLQTLKEMEIQLTKNQSLLQEKFFCDIFCDIHNDRNKVNEQLDILNIKLDNYHVLAFDFSNNNIDTFSKQENGTNILNEIKKFISIIFKEFDHYNVAINNNYISTIVNITKKSNKSSTEILHDKSKELIAFFNSFMSVSISLGISSSHSSIKDLQLAYDESKKSLSLRFYDNDSIFSYADCIQAESNADNKIGLTYVNTIIDSVIANDQELALSTLNIFFDELKNARHPISYIKNIGILISSLTFKQLINHNIDLSKIIDQSSKVNNEILNSDSISKMICTLKSAITSTIKQLSYIRTQNNDIIKKVTCYIKLNYQNSLKLDDLASFAHVNSSYLSRLIKQETGVTLTETIAKIRIDKAKELLQCGDLKTYEVANNVGIEDPAYFSQVFKKYTGLTPSEYKKIR